MALPPPANAKVGDYPINEEALVIVNMMDRLLETLVGVYEQQGVPLPARRYWMMGPAPAEDCEQVAICFTQGYLGAPGDQASDPQQCNQPRTGVINIWISRKHPAGGDNATPPSPESIMESSKWKAIDTAVLLWALNDLNQLPDWIPGPGVIATVNVNEPSGMIQSTVLNISRMIA